MTISCFSLSYDHLNWIPIKKTLLCFGCSVRLKCFQIVDLEMRRNDVPTISFDVAFQVLYFVSSNDEGSENVSCFEDWFKYIYLLHIYLSFRSLPRRCHRFSSFNSLRCSSIWNRISWQMIENVCVYLLSLWFEWRHHQIERIFDFDSFL